MSMQTQEHGQEVETLERVITWFTHSSNELTAEYRRLKERVASLSKELERKNQELEKTLHEREEARGYLLSVLESLKAGVLVLDRDLQPTFANRRMNELAGDVNRDRVAQLLGDGVARRLGREARDLLPLDCERVVLGPDGAQTPVHLTISEAVIAGDKSAGYVLVFQDISRLKRLEAETARSRRLAALGEMAAGVAHEIRSPLGGIELYASLLKERQEGETKGLAIDILKASQRLHTIISHLLSFVADPRINTGVLPVSSLLKEVKEITLPLFQDKKWALDIEEESQLPPLRGDRELLAQAIFNLVANATEAMSLGGTVRIEAQRSPHCSANGRIHRAVEIRVRDSGLGIPARDREKIFDPFFTTKLKGTGLGLALTHKITYAHNGCIEVSSNPDRGSCFTLFLPVVDGEEDYAETNCHS